MNQKQLSYFLEVYRTRNIQTAADKLFVSRQGVSKLIRTLEEELAQPLFHRTAQGLVPTEFATAMLPHAKALLHEYTCIAGMHSLAAQEKQVLTVFALDHIPNYLTADFLLDFHEAHPEIILSMVETTDDAALHGLDTQACDTAIVTGPIDNSRYQSTPLFFSHYCVRMNKTDSLSSKDVIRYEDLANREMASKGRAYRCFRSNIDQHLLLPGIPIQILAETTDETIIQQLILKRNAIYLGYDYSAIMHPHPDILLRPIDHEENGQYVYLVTRRDTLPTHASRVFQEFLLTWLADHQKNSIPWPF